MATTYPNPTNKCLDLRRGEHSGTPHTLSANPGLQPFLSVSALWPVQVVNQVTKNMFQKCLLQERIPGTSASRVLGAFGRMQSIMFSLGRGGIHWEICVSNPCIAIILELSQQPSSFSINGSCKRTRPLPMLEINSPNLQIVTRTPLCWEVHCMKVSADRSLNKVERE